MGVDITTRGYPVAGMSTEDLQDTLEAYGRRELAQDLHRVAELTAELSRRIITRDQTITTETEISSVLESFPTGPRFVRISTYTAGDPDPADTFVNIDDIVQIEPWNTMNRSYVWLRSTGRPLLSADDPEFLVELIAGETS